MKSNTDDYLKYWRVIRQYIKVKHGLCQADLDMILFLYSEKYFDRDKFEDFNQLSDFGIQPDETIVFFGGRSYLPLYLELTRNITAKKVIHHAQGPAFQIQGYVCIPYPGFTNWHYKCAQDFIDGKI